MKKDTSKKEVEIIEYSEKYYDDTFEYRHVVIPPKFLENDPITKLLEEEEWRKMGVVQSRGWVHYAIHRPEPHIMLFRRPRQDINAGNPNPNSVN